MTFDDFELDGTVKIKPIELCFPRRGGLCEIVFDSVMIYSIVFCGQDTAGRFLIDFYYRDGFAKRGIFRDQKHFGQFTKDVEKR